MQRNYYATDPVPHIERQRALRATWTEADRDRATQQAREWRHRAGYTDSKRAADQRRRAAKRNAVTETFSTSEVYGRDGWQCGICAIEVDPSLAWPHPMSASLDHIVPLSHGGDHTRANTRLAHLHCNVSRGNRDDMGLLG